MDKRDIPLCVDCDGTLIRTDLLHEAFFLMLKQYPLSLFVLPFWLFKGKAYLKHRIAEKVRFNWGSIPYRQEMLDVIDAAKAQGRQIVLATASPLVWAEGISAHLGCFDRVLASSPSLNMSAHNKASQLTQWYGQRAFEYAGNSAADIPVWEASAAAIVVSDNPSFRYHLSNKAIPVNAYIANGQGGILAYIKAIRVHQWLKNLLVFVPLLAAHQLQHAGVLVSAVTAFLSFSLCASAVYVLNDLLDLESDRLHVRKKKRPFASSHIPLVHGALMFPALLCGSALLASLLPFKFALLLGMYFTLTLAYSLRLKRQVIVDVILLATLYTMRIIAGAAATLITPSFWLLAFSMFIFLSLALVKRYSEMLITLNDSKREAAGRGYSVDDMPILMSLGVSSGMLAVLVFALYLNNPEINNIYHHKEWLWVIPGVILYWVCRIWMKTNRGQIDDDPVVFATRDWQSILLLAITAFFFLLGI